MKAIYFFTFSFLAFAIASCGSQYSEEEKAGYEKEMKAFCERKNWNWELSESGLFYEVLEEGNGGEIPIDAKIEVQYKGYLLNGKTFDNQMDSPVTLHTLTLIDGWREMLLFAQIGSHIRFVVPPYLGYKSRKVGEIPSNSILVFEAKILGLE
jgi:FKBP-type peptidyl-prolyl cis-trans isomerase